MTANEQNTVPSEAANVGANAYAETGDAIRVRLGVQPRTFQKVWKRTFGYAFDSRRLVTDMEREAMEAKYMVKPEAKPEPAKRRKVSVPTTQTGPEIPEGIEPKQASVLLPRFSVEAFAAWAMFIIPTIASIRNTVSVSGAFSGSHETALLITATISGTGILWIASRKNVSWYDMGGIFLFQLFEAFSNMVQVFKTLMGSMSYGITTVSGQPSELLEMVAVTTQSDHRDTALILAGGVAMFILAAQVKGLLLIKSMKQ